MKSNLSSLIFPFVYGISILILSFFVHQDDFISIFSFYTLSFAAYFLLGIENKSFDKWIKFSLWLKFILVFAFPLASDDIFRFYWDGMLSVQYISPYKFLPSEIITMDKIFIDQLAYTKLNSNGYYSVYPPALQILFGFCYFLSFKSVYLFSVLWKLILLCADIGSVYFIKKIQDSPKLHYWYAFNPLIMYEVFANGHPEGILLFFLCAFYWAIKENKLNWSFIFLSCASAIKIFPIVFFPLLVKKLKLKLLLTKSILSAFLLCLFFLPIFPHFDHFLESIKLYFNKFEFNGSFFEIWKWIDYRRFGFDNIAGISKFLTLGFLLAWSILTLRFYKSATADIFKTVFWIWLVYLLLATTVHPWYVLPLSLLGIFTHNLIGFAWSFLAILSYSWYDGQLRPWHYIVVSVEYLLLLLIIVTELFINKINSKNIFNS